MPLTAIAINCSLKAKEAEDSSTDKMIGLIVEALKKHDVAFAETIRIVDHDVRPGVTSAEGEGDAWPDIRRRILAADILIFGTPVWLGQMSSVAQRVLERMDAFLGETDDKGRMPSFGKIAIAAIVGNEDGAHAITASLFQALGDEGWTSRRAPPATGSARRCRRKISRSWMKFLSQYNSQWRWRRPTPPTSRACSKRMPIPASRHLQAAPRDESGRARSIRTRP